MKLKYVMNQELKVMGLFNSVAAEMTGLSIAAHNEELETLKRQAAEVLLALAEDQIETNSVLEGYRELVRGVGRSLKKFPPAAENLVRQVKRTGRFPSINTAVDSYNLVVAERMLALGVHDQAKLNGTITFRLSGGGESFTAVGSESAKMTQSGDFVYADESRVLAWLDSKDSDDVKVSLGTTELVIVIQGTARTERAYNWAAAEKACRLIQRFCGGTYDITAVD